LQQQKKEKVRIFALARELGMESKDLVVFCQQHGLDVKSQLSTIEPEVREQILQLVKKPTAPAAPPPPPPPAAVAPPAPRKIQTNPTAKPRTTAAKEPAAPAAAPPPVSAEPAAVAPPVAPPPAPVAPPRATGPIQTISSAPSAQAPPRAPAPAPEKTSAPAATAAPAAMTPPAQAAPSSPQETQPIPAEKTTPPAPVTAAPAARQPEAPAETPKPAQAPRPAQTPAAQAAGPQARPAAPGGAPGVNRPLRTLTPSRQGGQPGQGGTAGGQGGQSTGQGGNRPVRPVRPTTGQYGSTQNRSPVLSPRPQAAGQQAKPAPQGGIKKLGEITPEMMAQFAGQEAPPTPKQLEEARQRIERQARGPGVAPAVAPPVTEGEEDDRPGARAVPGRADRHKERAERQKARKGGEADNRGGKIDLRRIDDEPRHRKARPHHKTKARPTEERKGKIPVSVPITVRSLSEAMGKKSMDVLFKLMGHGHANATINSGVDPETAELIALEYGLELEIKRAVDVEQQAIDVTKKLDNPEDLRPRAPIVTIMGHVDHGKTSLLDRIRETYGLKSDVVSTEAGGITQVIRAWRVEKDGNPITFLDTPGHEAFTKMRARGANVTDIAVIVVAANDGVMPQTEEAVSHAKAAGVSIVVAINKVDLPDANLGKTERRLMDLGLIPDTMGGDVPFVQTSAKTGKGIDDLLEQLSVVAELKELKANPNKLATGTCLEAYKSEKEGVQATLLVREGTLHTGDVVLCGSSYGSVRRMYDDLGHTIESAGPSVPVRILGLDHVPNADDPFLVVEDLAIARQIAEDRKARDVVMALAPPKKAVTLEDLKAAKITELKVILKAEARGSIEAIRNELEKLKHDEVRVRILHAAIGGITVSDVQLALTSPEDTLILGFNVVPDNDAKALADERGIQIKQYAIIYQLANDIRAALEGKLKPREEVVQLGRAIVRDTFRISRVGTIAGCYVTQGVMERNAKIRVIRGGVVVYPPAERTAGLESLKRFKDDAREVREGFECGLRIAGYDDVKVDDVIECYRIEQVQRTLEK
jgi:translation initiation factor IF-2